MAGENDAVIEVVEDGVVEVSLEGLGAVVDAGEDGDGKKTPVVVTQKPSKPSAAEEAAAALNQAVAGRQAAEETAAAERRNADEARRQAAQRTEEAVALRETAEAQRLTIITDKIASAQREIDTAQADLERAGEAGDFKASAAAQIKLSTAAAELSRQNAAKESHEAAIKRGPTTEGRVEPQVQGNAFERYLAGFNPTAQTWLRAHPDCVPAEVGGDATKNAKMMAGHFDALGKGIKEGTPEYFKNIEEHAGYRQPVSTAAEVIPAGEGEVRKPATRQSVPRVSAPPSRDGQDGGGQITTQSVRLSPAQQETALFSYPAKPGEDDAAWRRRALGTYATEYVRAKNEGKIGRLTH